MKAMVLKQPGAVEGNPLDEEEVPDPSPGPGEVLLRVRACGVCRTDLHIVEGELPPVRLPIIPGHQIVGTVEAAGEGVDRFRKGDRAGVPWLYSACGRCDFCRREEENLCPEARFTGYHVPGGYAQYMTAPQDFAYPIPEGYSEVEAAPLLCAGIIGYRSLRLSGIKPGENLGLYGFGAAAHIAIQVARYWGCRVFVFTRGREHQRLARELGAVWVGTAEDTPPRRMDASIIFAPAGELVPSALEHLRPGGTLALGGIYMSPIPRLDYRLLYQERVIRSVTNSTRRDAREFLETASRAGVRTEVRVFPLEKANEALRMLKQGGIRGAAVLVVP